MPGSSGSGGSGGEGDTVVRGLRRRGTTVDGTLRRALRCAGCPLSGALWLLSATTSCLGAGMRAAHLPVNAQYVTQRLLDHFDVAFFAQPAGQRGGGQGQEQRAAFHRARGRVAEQGFSCPALLAHRVQQGLPLPSHLSDVGLARHRLALRFRALYFPVLCFRVLGLRTASLSGSGGFGRPAGGAGVESATLMGSGELAAPAFGWAVAGWAIAGGVVVSRRSNRSMRCSKAAESALASGNCMRRTSSSRTSRGDVVPRISISAACTISAFRARVAAPSRAAWSAMCPTSSGASSINPGRGSGTASSTSRSRKRSSRSAAKRRGS